MKKAILSSYGICAICLGGLLFSCSKDKEEPKEEENPEEEVLPPAKRILGLWNIVREIEIFKNTNTGIYNDTNYNQPVAPGIFTGEFRDNGKFYTAINDSHPEKDTIPYHFINDSTLSLDGDRYELRNFTKDGF